MPSCCNCQSRRDVIANRSCCQGRKYSKFVDTAPTYGYNRRQYQLRSIPCLHLPPASEVLLRHSDDFEQSRILFAGDLQDDLPARLDTAASRAHTQQFHHWQVLSRQMGDNARFSLVATADDVADCDTLIYYWPKNKPEAQFQLMNLLSLLPVGTDIFVVGENRSGVRSAEQMLADYAPLNKVDSARRCGLYFGRLEKTAGI